MKAKRHGTHHPRTVVSVPTPSRRLPNERDNRVIEHLATSPLGALKVDSFAGYVRRHSRPRLIPQIRIVRVALIKVYVSAAQLRLAARVPKEKIKSAETALALLWRAVKRLEEINPKHARGLARVLGIPSSDPKGLDESSAFSDRCWATRLEITKIAMALDQEVRDQKAKPSARGERKKRLRILVEALADWWITATGKRIAPYVQAKRLDNHRAFVVGRGGSFVEFAISIFSDLDEFRPSEVISAIINVNEHRRREQSRRAAIKRVRSA